MKRYLDPFVPTRVFTALACALALACLAVGCASQPGNGEIRIENPPEVTGAELLYDGATGTALKLSVAAGAVVAAVDELDAGELPRSARHSALEQVWATTYRDYRDVDANGTRWVMMLTERWTTLLRLDELDDGQLRRKLGAVSRLGLTAQRMAVWCLPRWRGVL